MYLLTEQQADTAGFKLLDLKACGGNATVYKAQHKATKKIVALKLLNPRDNSLRIHCEARVLNTLHHPNIATLVDVGEIGSMAYLATQWIDGQALRHLLDLTAQSEQPLLQIDLVLSITKAIASALNHAHSCGITHGDINPNNILISHELEAHVIDFGIGNANGEHTFTVTSELAGTPRYLAPELITGDSPSASSDQYALALVAYEMLSGRWPYSEQQATAATALHHQLYTQPTPISELRPALSASMDCVFARALSKSSAQRFASVSCFHDALSQASSRVETNRDRSISTILLRSSAIALALVLSLLMLTSIWWVRDDSTMTILASTSKAPSRDFQDISTNQTNSPDRTYPCNLYANSRFDNTLDDNFYRDAQIAELATRVNHPDAAESPILQLGDIDQYGIYGVILDITGGQRYSFSAELMFRKYVHKAELNILWLDESWQTIEGKTEKLSIERLFDGTFILANVIAPDMAHYAVPTLYKDASAGIMYADNVVFSATGETCKQP